MALIPKAERPDFDAFVRQSTPVLLRTALLLTSDRGHAEDIVQTTMLRVARRWSTARANPEPYARRVLVNLANDRWRSRLRRPAETRLHAGVEPVVAGPDSGVLDRSALLALLAEVPIGQRAVLVLRFLEDLSVAETADALGCSIGNVKSQTYHGLNRLRELLSEAGSEEANHADR